MKLQRGVRWLRLFLPGAVMFGLSGCLGPNPGFFISTNAAGAAIFTLVNSFLTDALGLSGG